jgi:hypothetical protein
MVRVSIYIVLKNALNNRASAGLLLSSPAHEFYKCMDPCMRMLASMVAVDLFSLSGTNGVQSERDLFDTRYGELVSVLPQNLQNRSRPTVASFSWFQKEPKLPSLPRPASDQEGVRKLLDIILGDVFSFFRDSAPEAFECIKISISRLKQFSSAKSDIHKKIVDGLEARSSTRPDKWPHHLTTFYFQQLIHLPIAR